MPAVMNPVPTHLAHVLMSSDVNARFSFRPTIVLHDNPGAFRSRKATALTAVFVIGLVMNRFPKKKGKLQKTTAQAVRKFLIDHFPGGTIIMQLGWWARVRDDSVKVIVENRDTGLSDREFRRKVNAVVLEALEKYGQYVIWLDYFRGTRRVGKSMEAYWKPK